MKTGMNMRTVKFGVASVEVALLSWTPTASPVGSLTSLSTLQRQIAAAN